MFPWIPSAIRLTDLEVRHLLLFKPNPTNIRWWFLATTLLTTCVNLYSTVFIAWRAWSANEIAEKSLYNYCMHLSSIAVESAGIYTIWTFILLAVVSLKDLTLWSFLLPISPSLYGCAMMLISVRLGLGWALGLGGQAAKKPKSLVMQFVRSESADSDYLEYRD
ncbi:hypothetical protein P691DRAFT_267031 [Macrolepiota fuliginosa MF-IS2]|uniref:Uncharacterized protein n=1 Tax=Macrolepiota fuliginosa MF-IS2 TaxID=1400762 RepID=A0A9P5XJI4_9AGAR|nr:hypothetical protein P691DRAFT_267031 [Macrolepiota fuliginosa MF-IS2]